MMPVSRQDALCTFFERQKQRAGIKKADVNEDSDVIPACSCAAHIQKEEEQVWMLR